MSPLAPGAHGTFFGDLAQPFPLLAADVTGEGRPAALRGGLSTWNVPRVCRRPELFNEGVHVYLLGGAAPPRRRVALGFPSR